MSTEPQPPAKLFELRTLSRATIVSIAATAIEFLILPSVGRLVPQWVAFASVQVVANLVTFLLYKYWAFEAGKRGSFRGQYARQIVVFGGSWVFNTVIPSLLYYELTMEQRIAFALSNIVVYLAWNYPLSRAWVFKHAPA